MLIVRAQRTEVNDRGTRRVGEEIGEIVRSLLDDVLRD